MTTGNVPYIANVDAGSTKERLVELIIWDTPGLGINQCLENIKTIQQVKCVVLCYSVGDPDLIANIDNHVSSATSNLGRSAPHTLTPQ